MAGEIIRQGDPTDHGGKVLEGSLTDICHGKPIAYIGHKVPCPKCKGTFPIIEGVLTTTFYGKGVAIAGMKTACGATLAPPSLPISLKLVVDQQPALHQNWLRPEQLRQLPQLRPRQLPQKRQRQLPQKRQRPKTRRTTRR